MTTTHQIEVSYLGATVGDAEALPRLLRNADRRLRRLAAWISRVRPGYDARAGAAWDRLCAATTFREGADGWCRRLEPEEELDAWLLAKDARDSLPSTTLYMWRGHVKSWSDAAHAAKHLGEADAMLRQVRTARYFASGRKPARAILGDLVALRTVGAAERHLAAAAAVLAA